MQVGVFLTWRTLDTLCVASSTATTAVSFPVFTAVSPSSEMDTVATILFLVARKGEVASHTPDDIKYQVYEENKHNHHEQDIQDLHHDAACNPQPSEDDWEKQPKDCDYFADDNEAQAKCGPTTPTLSPALTPRPSNVPPNVSALACISSVSRKCGLQSINTRSLQMRRSSGAQQPLLEVSRPPARAQARRRLSVARAVTKVKPTAAPRVHSRQRRAGIPAPHPSLRMAASMDDLLAKKAVYIQALGEPLYNDAVAKARRAIAPNTAAAEANQQIMRSLDDKCMLLTQSRQLAADVSPQTVDQVLDTYKAQTSRLYLRGSPLEHPTRSGDSQEFTGLAANPVRKRLSSRTCPIGTI